MASRRIPIERAIEADGSAQIASRMAAITRQCRLVQLQRKRSRNERILPYVSRSGFANCNRSRLPVAGAAGDHDVVFGWHRGGNRFLYRTLLAHARRQSYFQPLQSAALDRRTHVVDRAVDYSVGHVCLGGAVYIRAHRPPENPIEVYVVAKQWMWKIGHQGGRREINALHVPIGRPCG